MDALKEGAQSLLGLDLTQTQVAAFQLYANELAEWNARFNLTAIKEPRDVQVKHFLDSLTVLKALPAGALRVIDVGTGAGFPGLPLKILRPELRMTLVEATGKKVRFCEHIATRLGLEGVRVVHARAEEVGQLSEHRERYDWAVARAVAEMPVLAEYLLPLVVRGGGCIAQKSKDAPAEVHGAETALRKLGGTLERLIEVELPGVVDPRYLIVLRKNAATPAVYPRRPGLPTKQPIQ
ncbi:MAG TPA: 16S rRNA (guanine(527)-N(7))-methyltransferase RsmG [Anaerolineales bacterium]|nr:16S rRNA (guanine(527)-N(7))-methyltransferase RsmG [Anaerolineales bacterium]HRF48326.1 16S rRNA (guanine(527)-N(7))-methyltransferase RsmG [Anaerolineales bacterium]